MLKKLFFIATIVLCAACTHRPEHFSVEVMNGFTPVKNQGRSQTCWAYAMLAAIETEHIMRGDSVHLSVAFVEKMIERETHAPANKRGMGMTALNIIDKYGLVPYDTMPDTSYVPPRKAFMYGVEYSLKEFAHSVCAPGEYVGLTSNTDHFYGKPFEPLLPDNWEHNRLFNVPADTLLALTERAVRTGHGVCWEGDTSERGFNFVEGYAVLSEWCGSTTDDHCMAIVGIAHDERGNKYFIMKNSWGTRNRYHGLMFMSFDYFKRKTLAIYMTRAVCGDIL